MIDLGGYYHFKHNPNEQFLFCYGHSVAGQTENYAYVGMYWTWGKDAKAPAASGLLGGAPGGNGLGERREFLEHFSFTCHPCDFNRGWRSFEGIAT